jgi:hypothetical protein
MAVIRKKAKTFFSGTRRLNVSVATLMTISAAMPAQD